MTETPDAKTYQATPRGTLLEQIMDATQAKNEREWAAMREIETLRQRVAELEESEKSWIERGNYWTDEAAKINAELAALKIDNGLTIAYMSGFRDGKKDAQQSRLNELLGTGLTTGDNR